MDRDSKKLLRGLSFFRDIGEDSFDNLVELFRVQKVQSGEVLFRQDDPPNGIYIVLTGRLYYEKLIHEYGNPRKVRGEFTRGSIIGDIAILTGLNRTAGVISYRDSELLFLSLKNWNLLLNKYPDSYTKLTQYIFSSYYQNQSKEIRIPQRMISVMPLSKSISESFFSESLKKSLEKFGDVKILRRSEYRKLSKIELRELFYKVEKDSKFTIFETCFDEEWTEFCFHHSDRVLILDEVGGTGNLRKEESDILSHAGILVDLVLLSEGSCNYLDTGRWTHTRSINSKFILDSNLPQDFDRLARHIAGKSIGIALGGGGARGFAHIGVMEGLRELGIDVDRISGTSIGSIVGSLYALKKDQKEILELTKKYFVDRNPTSDIHLSPVSLTRGEIFTSSLMEAFRDLRIEFTNLPFYAVACNLTKGSLHVFEEGEIWKALRASSSIPGLSPPLLIDNDVYIDGGILNNLPCDIIKDRGADFVIGVDITGKNVNQNSRIMNYLSNNKMGVTPSFWDGWSHTLKDFWDGNQTPIVMEIMVASGMVGSKIHKDSIQNSIDLLLQPETDGYGLLDWKKMEDLVQKGREIVLKNEKNIIDRIKL